MKILSTNSNIYVNSVSQNRSSFNKLKPLSFDCVSFTSKKQSETPMWDDFQEKFQMVYPNQQLEDVLETMILKEENKLGEGVKKIVYSIDGIDDYVVAFFKKNKPVEGAKIVGVKDVFPEFNFGQEVATNNANITIMKKIDGEVNSIPDWTKTYQALVYGGEDVTPEQAKIFLKKLSEVESFPLESYIDFARQVRYLTDRRIKIDLFNPNNILINPKNKKITHFDLFENPSIFHGLGAELNGTQDMVNILVDALLHAEYAKVLSDEDRELLMQKTRSITQKCEIAGKIVGLSDDKSIALRTYEFLQKLLYEKKGRNTMYTELYRNFQEMYGI